MRACLGWPPGRKRFGAPYPQMQVLVVHSEPRFFREIKGLLAQQEIHGSYLTNLSDLRQQLEAQFPDLIILEQRCLVTGSEQFGAAFNRSQRLPVIFLTSADSERISAGEERNRLAGLISHLQSQSERMRSAQVIQVGQMRIHEARMRVALGDNWIKLPPIQFRILRHLAANANAIVSHHELASAVWGSENADDETKRDSIKVHIVQLRRTLGPAFKNYIQAVRGEGYVLVDPEADD